MKLKAITEAAEMEKSRKTKWFKTLEKHGEVFFVGGAVRDQLIGKDSKDIDLVVRGLTLDQIAKILKPFGKPVMNSVGGKQAVIKFVPRGESEEIDIAIPRTEKKTGAGHKGFDINTDPNLSLRKDLERRDFTINAIAKDADGKLFDPFGGQKDMKNKVIRAVSKSSFKDDPLRMLRAVQFASRFGFTIEPDTFQMIKKTAPKIKEISGERILIEFDKIIRKGDPRIGTDLLNKTGLFKALFGKDFKGDPRYFNRVNTMGEFVFLLLSQFPDADSIYKHQLRGDNSTASEIRALKIASQPVRSKGEARMQASRAWANADISKSKLLSAPMMSAMKDLKSKYPKELKELAVSGRDLGQAGFRGKEIGDALQKALQAVYDDKVDNDKEAILDYLS